MFPPTPTIPSTRRRFRGLLPHYPSNTNLRTENTISRTPTEILTEYKPKSITKQRSQLLEQIKTPVYDAPVTCECVGRCIDNDCPCFKSRQYCDEECHGCSTSSTDSPSAFVSAAGENNPFWGVESKSAGGGPNNEKGIKKLVKRKSAIDILRKLGIIHPPLMPISSVVEKDRFKPRPKWGKGLGWKFDGETSEGKCGNWV